VKYEVWPNVFFELKKRSVPLHLFSARFRTEQRFFSVFSFFWKSVLQAVTQFYVQENTSEKALHDLGFDNVVVTGDTRFDRVLEISKADLSSIQSRIDTWKESSKILVLGSS
jgi:3-deoxy-D-manno-octulosonic-acid transferase